MTTQGYQPKGDDTLPLNPPVGGSGVQKPLEEKLIAELKAKITTCESALISMVQQYLYRPLDPTTNEPADNIYQHDFMSAGEEAFAYLVEHGLAEWTDDRHWAIRMKESEE